MAIGAVGDEDLALRVGTATGLELAALGINFNYAPVADIASRPYNPSLGIRSFGEDPGRRQPSDRRNGEGPSVRRGGGHPQALSRQGGSRRWIPICELPVLDLDLERLNRVEFAPFRAGIEAGARFVMIGHYGLPAITGNRQLPSSASSAVLRGLVRDQLGFDGVIVTDALDMGAFEGVSLEEPLSAGCDLLLYGPAQAGTLPVATPSFIEAGFGDGLAGRILATRPVRHRKLRTWCSGSGTGGPLDHSGAR